MFDDTSGYQYPITSKQRQLHQSFLQLLLANLPVSISIQLAHVNLPSWIIYICIYISHDFDTSSSMFEEKWGYNII